MLQNLPGIIQYIFLPNDIVWERLSATERSYILTANRAHNIDREDYKNPEQYGEGRVMNGENWDSQIDRLIRPRGKILAQILNAKKPHTILEIGPGPGFYTKILCEAPSVQSYVAVDIGQAFLDYLGVRLQKLAKTKALQYELLCKEFEKLDFGPQFDMIVLLSTVHHIPNREELFAQFAKWLKPGGCVVAIDPTHYLLRIANLTTKLLWGGYSRRIFWTKRTNLSTHHMCTYREYKKIARAANLRITDEWYLLPKGRVIPGHSPWRYLAREMGIVLEKSIV